MPLSYWREIKSMSLRAFKLLFLPLGCIEPNGKLATGEFLNFAWVGQTIDVYRPAIDLCSMYSCLARERKVFYMYLLTKLVKYTSPNHFRSFTT